MNMVLYCQCQYFNPHTTNFVIRQLSWWRECSQVINMGIFPISVILPTIVVHMKSSITEPLAWLWTLSSKTTWLLLHDETDFWIKCQPTCLLTGQYGGPPQGMPGYMPGGIPPYGQAPPVVPQGYQGAPPRPPMGMRPPVMSPGGRYWSLPSSLQ